MPYRIILNLKNILMKPLLIQRFSGFFFFDEKDPTIFIRTHNTDLKNRLTAPYREERRRAASEAAKNE